MSSIRVLIADDYEDWRKRVRLLLQARPEWQAVGEASDGLEVLQKVDELRPNVILLEIGLPTLNGIEVARRIRRVSPNALIIFLTVDNSPDLEEVALRTGALGYVYKPRAQRDLLPAIEAALRGEQFVSRMSRS